MCQRLRGFWSTGELAGTDPDPHSSCLASERARIGSYGHLNGMMTGIFIQVLSLAGAAFILSSYIGHAFGWLDSRRALYNSMNTLGAALLAYVALHPFSAGFLILEGTWTVVSLMALLKALRSRPESL